MQTLDETAVPTLEAGEFYLPWYNSQVLENELAPVLAINSGIVVISGPVNTGKTHLLQAFASAKIKQGLNVLLVAHEHNEIQGVDTLIFHKTDWLKNKITSENIDIMLARIDAINPDVVLFDDMNYSEILAMANVLAEKGTLVLTVNYFSPYGQDSLASRFDLISDIEGKDFRHKQEELIKGHILLKSSLIRTPKANAETKIIAKVLKY